MGSAVRPERFGTLGSRPSATLVTGESRPLINRVAFALARMNDPGFVWVDLQPRKERLDPDSPTALGWVPSARLFVIDSADEGRPQPGVGDGTVASALRPDAADRRLAAFPDYLRLPPVAQEAIARRLRDADGPRLVAFPNSDYLRKYYGPEPERIRPVLQAIVAQELSALFASVAAPVTARRAFEFVFDVRAESRARWQRGSLVCELAPRWSGLLAGESTPLPEIPEVAAALA